MSRNKSTVFLTLLAGMATTALFIFLMIKLELTFLTPQNDPFPDYLKIRTIAWTLLLDFVCFMTLYHPTRWKKKAVSPRTEWFQTICFMVLALAIVIHHQLQLFADGYLIHDTRILTIGISLVTIILCLATLHIFGLQIYWLCQKKSECPHGEQEDTLAEDLDLLEMMCDLGEEKLGLFTRGRTRSRTKECSNISESR